MVLKNETTRNEISLILDSSLITQCRGNHPSKNYSYKVIDCGEYIQVYKFEFDKLKKDELWQKDIIKKIDTDNLTKKSKPLLHEIELKNIIRSKLQCQRLAKCNLKEWGSFITLTFEENITDIKTANKIFNTWRTNIKSLKKDFIYLAVPEFQKRGAVHYHILSNLTLKDTNIITSQKGSDKYYDVKYWKYGFSAFDDCRGDIQKIIGYISKYMTKDADNRLYGFRRYLCSQDILKPKTNYIDLDVKKDTIFLENLLNDTKIDFQTTYLDTYTNTSIEYMEYKKQV